nr:hypothetical protein [Dehalococcoidales bacterium]
MNTQVIKAISIVIPLGVFALASMPAHEYGHCLAAEAFGVNHTAHLSFFNDYMTHDACRYDWVIGLSGGLFVF